MTNNEQQNDQMNVQLLEDPTIRKMLHSIQCAFPVQEDPWHDLAFGLGLSREDLQSTWTELVENGVILGLRLEIDPQHSEYQEWLAPASSPPAEALLRHQLTDEKMPFVSVLARDADQAAERPEYLEYAWPAQEWLKVGTTFEPQSSDKPDNLLAPMSERTFAVNPQAYQQNLPLSDDSRQMMEQLSSPVPVTAEVPVWKQLGAHLKITNMDYVREAISKILLAKRARRFHVVLNPKALGYHGAVLAGWNIPPESARQAAAALASVRAAADVAIRKPTQKFPANLSALILSNSPESCQQTLEAITEKWGVKTVFQQPVTIEYKTLS